MKVKYCKKHTTNCFRTYTNMYSCSNWFRIKKYRIINKSVGLADLLLLFLYLEVLAMIRIFWESQTIRITLPLLIAITALSRFIILQGKEQDPSALVYEAVAIVLIASAIVIIRLRHSKKLGLSEKKKKIILSLKIID